jgi:NAD(P)-dependent dehydrogenase (short-subunit alcohol dehydrogenase family)
VLHAEDSHYWLFVWIWFGNRKAFLDHGWDVVATMRTPRAELLPKSDRLRILPLDITDPASVTQAVAEAG